MKLAIFDFDRTLFPKDTIPYLMKQWYKLDYSKSKIAKTYIKLIPAYMMYKSGVGNQKTKEKLRRVAVESFHDLFKGMSKKEIDDFFYKASLNLKDELNENIVSKLKEAKKLGMHTVIISGAYDPLLKFVGENLGVDTIIGTQLIFDHNDIYDYNQKLILMEGDQKADELVKHFEKIHWEDSIFYTDSIRDLKLLQLVGTPVVVNPDTHLLNNATELNWEIIY